MAPVRRQPSSTDHEGYGPRRLVGLGRLELPTSRLSSARSNQLSYKPEPLPSALASLRPSRRARKSPQLRFEKTARARPGRKRNEGGEVPQMAFRSLKDRRPDILRDPRNEERDAFV